MVVVSSWHVQRSPRDRRTYEIVRRPRIFLFVRFYLPLKGRERGREGYGRIRILRMDSRFHGNGRIMKDKKPTLLLVDGNALIHRGFHAIPHLSTKKGEPTNGVYGFALLLLNALKEVRPQYAAVTFDPPGPTFRDKIYDEYKAGRIKAPDELYQQIPRVKELVSAFNMPIFEKSGYEADDMIGTLSAQADKEGLSVVILTGDYDTLQLVNGNIRVFAPKKGLSETGIYGEKEVETKYGLRPSQLVDYKALRGDPSDNIPGVKGVGEKTATELLQKFGTLERVYKNLEKLKPRIADLLRQHEKDAELSQKLATIVRDAPVKLEVKKCELSDFDEKKVVKLFQELEFRSLLGKIPKVNPSSGLQPPSPAGGEGNKDYHLVDTEEKLARFLSELKKQKEFAIDTETTSQHPRQADLVGIGFSWRKGEAWYLPANLVTPHPASVHPLPQGARDIIKILSDIKIKKIGHNIKYDYLVLRRAGIDLRGMAFDTMIASYLLNPGARGFDLDTLAFTEFGHRKIPIAELIGVGKKQISMAEVPAEKVSEYCCEDTDYTWRLKERLEKELHQKKMLEKLFFEIEMPLLQVLAEMEWAGIKVEPKVLRKLSLAAASESAMLEKKIHKLAGGEFNIASPIQLKEVLFEKLEISQEGLKKGKTGVSTAATELEKMRGLHPIIDLISDFREVAKLQNTYLDALPELINKETGRIHTSFNQTIAATGRLSSTDPNLQNIPIRTELGRKVRGAFVAEKGYKFLSVDYSQIELRLAAHLSGDRKMTQVFKAGGDIHDATAKEIGVSRRFAKAINFGILYGLSAFGLTSRIPEVTQPEAREFIEKYKAAYKELMEYLHEVILQTRKKGYVENELGRIRNLPEINSSQFQVRAGAERAALNMPLQSLAADIIKMAMNKLGEEGLVAKNDCRLLLQVHDELLFEIEESKVKEYAKKIVNIMERAYKLKVPLVAEAKAGEDWEKMAKVNI